MSVAHQIRYPALMLRAVSQREPGQTAGCSPIQFTPCNIVLFASFFFFFLETDFLSESASLSSPLLRTDPAEHCTRASPSASPILQTPEEFGSLISLPVGPLFRIFGIAWTPPRHDPPGFRSASLCFRHLSPPGGCSPSLGGLLLLSSPDLH